MENPYEEAHWGSFTKQWKNRKPEYKNYDTLEKFADFILANPNKFNKISKQRSHFYKNLIQRGSGNQNKGMTKPESETEDWGTDALFDIINEPEPEHRNALIGKESFMDETELNKIIKKADEKEKEQEKKRLLKERMKLAKKLAKENKQKKSKQKKLLRPPKFEPIMDRISESSESSETGHGRISKKCESMYGGQMTRDLYNYHRQIGGKMSISQFQKFLTNSYSKTPEQKIDDFEYDPELSIDRAKVYHDPKTGHAVITHTGTDSATDWLNNLAISAGVYKYTPRYKNAKKAQEATEKKYGKQNVSTTGHSQGARISELVGKNSKEILTLNKATNPFEQHSSKNQTDVRSSGDWVSSLNPLGWMEKNKKVVIPKKSNNIIKEHSPDVLSRIDPNMIIGEGRKRKINKKLRNLCCCGMPNCCYC